MSTYLDRKLEILARRVQAQHHKGHDYYKRFIGEVMAFNTGDHAVQAPPKPESAQGERALPDGWNYGRPQFAGVYDVAGHESDGQLARSFNRYFNPEDGGWKASEKANSAESCYQEWIWRELPGVVYGPEAGLDQYFGGGWTPHKPGDFIPQFEDVNKVEFLVNEDPHSKQEGEPRIKVWGAGSARAALNDNKGCWSHEKGWVHVLGYRYKRGIEGYNPPTIKPPKPGLYHVKEFATGSVWSRYWTGTCWTSGGEDAPIPSDKSQIAWHWKS